MPRRPVGPAQRPFDQVVAGTRERHHRSEAGGQQRPTGPPDGGRRHEHDDRPVPQVQAVGDEADPADRAEGQHHGHHARGARMAPTTTTVAQAAMATSPPSQIHDGGPPAVATPITTPTTPEHGQRRPPTGRSGPSVVPLGRCRLPPSAARPWPRLRPSGAPRPGCRCPGRPGWARTSGPPPPSTRPRPPPRARVQPSSTAASAATAPGRGSPRHGQDQERPDQVVLLLDGQRPRVLERADRQVPGEVAVAGHDLLPVGHVEQGGQGRGAQLGRDQAGAAGPGVEREGHQQDQHRGKEPLAPGVPRSRPGSPRADPRPAGGS